MPLPSHVTPLGTRTRRRRRGRNRRLGWLVLLSIGAAGAFGFWQFSGSSPEEAVASGSETNEQVQEERTPSSERSADEPTGREDAAPEQGERLALNGRDPLETREPIPSIDLTQPDPEPEAEPSVSERAEPSQTSADEAASRDRAAQPTQDPGAAGRRPALSSGTSQTQPEQLAQRQVGRNTPYSARMQEGMDQIASGEHVAGRATLSGLLLSDEYRLLPHDARTIRDTLNSVNRELVFSGRTERSDDMIDFYRVSFGQTLGGIAREHAVPYGLLERINHMRANQLQANQSIRVINGPIHGRVHKSQYVMDTYIYDENDNPVFLHSFRVGLGADDSTPIGSWIVTPGGKVVNPDWRNPRTGEYFASDDPDNPIGGFWIGLTGADDATRNLSGYGIHGTIEPDSIGRQESMGCVRLRDGDIELAFDMLTPGRSEVTILE